MSSRKWGRAVAWRALAISGLCLAALGCGGNGSTPSDSDASVAHADAGPAPGTPEHFCPGSAGCTGTGDDVLYVGSAKEDVTPVIDATTDVQTVDVNMNGEYDPEQGDRFADNNGNHVFDGIWIAGYGTGRSARGVHDPQWIRVVALRVNDVTVVLGSIDCVGYFNPGLQELRDRVRDLDVDFVTLSATHSHEARDTMGIWGVSDDTSGTDPAYQRLLVDRAERAVRNAVAALAPSTVQYATFRLRDQPGGQTRYVADSRDPYVLDDEARILRFAAKTGGATIATLVNLGAHAEYAGDSNTLLSSDWVHFMREAIENGVDGPAAAHEAGVGGMAIFFQGAIGSQIGPGRVNAQEWDGTPVPRRTPPMAEAVGKQLGYFALRALGSAGGSVIDETATLAFRTTTIKLRIQNRGFHIAFLQGLFPERPLYDWNPDLALVPGVNEPSLVTEAAVIDLGRASLLTVPGELDPVLWLGGYDGAYTPNGVPVVDATQENPPDLTHAPAGPYLRDRMRADAEYRFILGLTADELGYFLPDFDFELDPGNPYLDEAPGDHYEETVSIGVGGWSTLRAHLEGLLGWHPPAR